ncbi:hypothetical protein GCM10027343_29180 [Noviherbaspirillum agri]
MKLPRKCTATNAPCFLLLLLASLLTAVSAWAGEVAGTVTHLSGPLLAKKADGTVMVLAQKSTVEQGDTLISEKETYARIKFIDNSEITLRPNSQLKIDSFAYDEAQPEKDSAAFSLIKGGLRAVTGLLGKRNKERVGVNTPTATIGIRGTIFIADYVPVAQASDGRAPGLYVQVVDGAIVLRNNGGSHDFSAGQFGFSPSITQAPILLPADPGIQFTPPPGLSSTSGPQGSTGSAKTAPDVDCEVR